MLKRVQTSCSAHVAYSAGADSAVRGKSWARKFPSEPDPGAEPLVGVRGKSPGNGGLEANTPKAEQFIHFMLCDEQVLEQFYAYQ